MLKKEIKDKITEKSMRLSEYGINDLSWNKEDARILINDIMQDKIGILGGDVYRLTSAYVEPLYDNWSCEPDGTESEEEYFLRSKVESLEYIEKYLVQPTETIVFSIVFTEKIE